MNLCVCICECVKGHGLTRFRLWVQYTTVSGGATSWSRENHHSFYTQTQVHREGTKDDFKFFQVVMYPCILPFDSTRINDITFI